MKKKPKKPLTREELLALLQIVWPIVVGLADAGAWLWENWDNLPL